MHGRGWRWVLVALAALVLASCGTVDAPVTLSATPSVDISVGLSIAACEGSGVCFALGQGDPSAGQVTTNGSTWAADTVPTTFGQLDGSSCWHGGCLVFGTGDAGPFVWRTAGLNFASASAPASFASITAIDCFATEACAVVGMNAAGVAVSAVTENDATSWLATVVPFTFARPAPARSCGRAGACSVTALSCVDTVTCYLTGEAGSRAIVMVTDDAGATWSERAVGRSFTSLSNLFCRARTCIALGESAAPGHAETVVRSTNGGATWVALKVRPPSPPADLECTSTTTCVASAANGFSIEVLSGGAWSTRALRYDPASLIAGACGTSRCVFVEQYGTVTLRA